MAMDAVIWPAMAGDRCDATTKQGNHCSRRPLWEVRRRPRPGRPAVLVARVCQQHRDMMERGAWIPWHGGEG